MSELPTDSESFDQEPPPGFSYKLSAQLISGLVILIALILLISTAVIWFKGRPLLEDLGQRSRIQQAQNVALALEQKVSEIIGITRSLAAASAQLPHDSAMVKSVVPPLLNQLGKNSMIAGGGIWPEPHAFKQGVIRHSFFWGRNNQGELVFFDNYNDPESQGYQNEEWYVPARLLKEGEVYWSKSYTDPYSLQPIVTCTAPIVVQGQFRGVATIDLKLDVVSLVLEQLVNGLDAYAFVVDRNNKFIAYPYPDRVMTVRQQGETKKPDYLDVRELADIQPSFAYYARHLGELDRRLFSSFSERSSEYSINVNILEHSSYQIENSEARRIAAHLWQQSENKASFPKKVDLFSVPRDAILAESASAVVFQMPSTNWKVVTVFRNSSFLKAINTVSKQMLWYMSLATLFFGAVAYALLRMRILKPIHHMVEQLSQSVNKPGSASLHLDYKGDDELGLLASWFNAHSKQLQMAKEESERSNSAKTAFLAKMSHELRTPLNSINGFSKKLLKKLKGDMDDFHYQALERIHANGQLLLSLISDILDVTAIESGDVKLHLEWCSVNQILLEAEAEVNIFAAEKDLDFRIYQSSEHMEIHCDRSKVQQILVNLLTNAVKATVRGYVRARVFYTESRPGFIGFEVSDSGVGISEMHQKKLFKQFTQLNDKLGSERGTGLGLYIVKELVTLHGGDISLSSRLGEGSVFTFYLPADAEPVIRQRQR